MQPTVRCSGESCCEKPAKTSATDDPPEPSDSGEPCRRKRWSRLRWLPAEYKKPAKPSTKLINGDKRAGMVNQRLDKGFWVMETIYKSPICSTNHAASGSLFISSAYLNLALTCAQQRRWTFSGRNTDTGRCPVLCKAGTEQYRNGTYNYCETLGKSGLYSTDACIRRH